MKYQSEQVMQQHVAIWRFLGFWPLPSDRFYHYIFFGYMRLTCIILFPLGMILAIPEAKDVDELTNVLMPVTVGFLASAKSLCIIYNNSRIKRLFGIMHQLDSTEAIGGPEDAREEQNILNDALKLAKGMMNYWLTINILCAIASMLRVLIFTDGEIAWPSVYPWSWNDNYYVYLATVIMQFAYTLFYGACTLELYGPAAYILLSAYLQVLGLRLRSLGYSKDGLRRFDELVPSIESKLARELELIECIKYYETCLRYAKCLNEIFGIHYSVQFGVSGLYICSSAFQLLVVHDMSSGIVLFWCVFIVSLHVFGPCYFGSIITEQSRQISIQMYDSNWMDQSTAFKQSMRILCERSKKPIELKTYKNVFIIALPTFVMIMRAAYSLLSCISRM